jgi:hypothetical protein
MPSATIGDKTYPLPDNFDQISYDRQQAILGDLEKQHLIVGPKSPDKYASPLWPFRITAEDKVRPGWGLASTVASSLYDAAKLPGDFANQQLGLNAAPFGLGPKEAGQPIIDPLTGRPSAAFTDRATNFAGTVNLTSPANLAGRRQMMLVPTTQQLHDAGDTGLNIARSTGMEIGGGEVNRLGQNLLAQYRREGYAAPGAPTAPQSGALGGSLANYAGDMPVADLMSYRQQLTKLAYGPAAGSPEGAAASIAIGHIDRLFDRLPQVQTKGGTIPAQEVASILRDANANWAASKRSNLLTGETDREISGILPEAQLQAGATYSGRNLDNAIRQRAAAALKSKDIMGYSADEIADLTEVAMGTAAQNKLRLWANRLGAGGGIGQGVAAGSAGGVAGTTALAAGVDPYTASMLGFGTAGVVGKVGDALKALQNLLSARNVRKLDEQVRLRSPLAEQKLARQDPATSATGYHSLTDVPLTARDAAILHTLMPGLLAPPPPPAKEPSWQPGERLPRGYI